MKLEVIKVGSLECNCYILSIDNDVIVIDPGDNYLKIKEKIGNKNLLAVLITHYHFDHIGALDEIKKDYNIKIYDYKMKEKEYKEGKFKFKIIKMPGHTFDSVIFYFENYQKMFVGDFIFKGSIGRCDFESSSITDMKKSLKKIITYPDDIKLYPGHGDITSIKDEKENNIFLKGDVKW